MKGDRRFQYEKLRVYHEAVEFSDMVDRIVAKYGPQRPLMKNLKRSSESILYNIAEAAAEFRPLEKGRIYPAGGIPVALRSVGGRAVGPVGAAPDWGLVHVGRPIGGRLTLEVDVPPLREPRSSGAAGAARGAALVLIEHVLDPSRLGLGHLFARPSHLAADIRLPTDRVLLRTRIPVPPAVR